MPRIAGAIFRAATDPDLATSGCPWVLPDDGPVIRVEKEALRTGVYEMLGDRGRRITRHVPFASAFVRVSPEGANVGPSMHSFTRTVGDWALWARNLGVIFRPVLSLFVPIVVIAVAVSLLR